MPTGIMADFDDAVAKTRRQIENALPLLESIMKTETSNSVDDNVYGAYYPTEYERRGDAGGMSDTKNYATNIYVPSLTVVLTNETTGNPAYSGSRDGWDSDDISDIVESGNGYNWRRSRIFKTRQARPYMDKAEEKAAKAFEPVLTDAYLSM